MGVMLSITGLFVLNNKNEVLKAKLASQQHLTEQYEALSRHRRQQLDDLHALLNEHNKRFEADLTKLASYQSQLEELENYLSEEMAHRDDVCLNPDDVKRLRQLWGAHSTSPH